MYLLYKGEKVIIAEIMIKNNNSFRKKNHISFMVATLIKTTKIKRNSRIKLNIKFKNEKVTLKINKNSPNIIEVLKYNKNIKLT